MDNLDKKKLCKSFSANMFCFRFILESVIVLFFWTMYIVAFCI